MQRAIDFPKLGARARVPAALLLLSLLPPAVATAASEVEVMAQLRDQALAGSPAWEIVESLVTEVGARPAGSPAMTRAREWALRKLTALGFENVHAEQFVKHDAWQRGPESAAIVEPVARELAIAGLGNSVPTAPAGIEAPVVVFSSLQQLIEAPVGSLRDKIALVNQPTVRTQDGEGYRSGVRARVDGPSLAAARGAVAFLTRSITPSKARLAHTGATRYAQGAPRIPAAAIAVPDAELIARLAARGAPVRVRLRLSSTTIAAAPAWNVVGEVRGRDLPDQVLIIGGHLDSWDLSECASDDGAGVAITTAAAALIGRLPQHPHRTIRVVLWGSEETAGSGAAYAAAHRTEVPNIILAAESDMGAARAYRLLLPPYPAADQRMAAIVSLLAPLRVLVSADPALDGGADLEELHAAGVPVANLNQDQTHYFDVHHSADDTLAHVQPADLDQNVAVWVVVLYAIADSGINLRAPSP
jgi:hypothetical protein